MDLTLGEWENLVNWYLEKHFEKLDTMEES
jgi:hypothetical protein